MLTLAVMENKFLFDGVLLRFVLHYAKLVVTLFNDSHRHHVTQDQLLKLFLLYLSKTIFHKTDQSGKEMSLTYTKSLWDW